MTASCARTRRTLIAACSLASLAANLPTSALAATAVDAAEPGGAVEDIYVIGTRVIRDTPPERELDAEGIEAYGQSTISDLLSELQGELGDDEEPLILVNGERITDVSDVGGLPVEALDKVRVLPRGTAVAAGGRAKQRVLDVQLKRNFRSATLLAATKFATDGDWHSERGEATLSYIRGPTRANVTFKARPESDLLESERDIRQPDPSSPFYALGGNVIAYPVAGQEIDPFLSAAAGETVKVTPVPEIPNPDLLDFVDSANDPATTDIGEFRTLRPRTRNYDLNGTFATRLTPWLTGNVGLRFSNSTRRSLRGLPQALFLLSPTNPSSPFSTAVRIAQYGTEPLETRSERNGGEGNVSLNARFGQWTGIFSARHSRYKDTTDTERTPLSGNVTIPDSMDPFASDLFSLVSIQTSRSEAKTTKTNANLSFTGPLFELPAGTAQATFEAEYDRNRIRSESDFSISDRDFRRTETTLRAALDVPLTARNGFGGAIGDLSVSADLSRVHFSDAGNITNHEFGIAWEPHPVLRLSADFEESSQPPIVQFIGNPIIITSGVRTFDPLTGETVDVTQITGGNPELEAEKTSVKRLGAIIRPLERLNLQLNAEYIDTTERNFVSSLPEASAAVMLAFPDRFIRNLDNVLTTVDLRPVNFDAHREKRFRYGFNFTFNVGKSGHGAAAKSRPVDPDTEDDAPPARVATAKVAAGRKSPPTRVSVTASHSIVFEDTITIRQGLPEVDLLDGGAIGIGGGRVRHQFDATASLASGGTGIRLTANWRGKSKLNALDGGESDKLFFSPVFNLGLRAFTDLHRFLPHTQWAKGMRLSLNVQNLTNDRQGVRDSTGETPLRYQPGYRDPLGRTVEFEIRKVF